MSKYKEINISDAHNLSISCTNVPDVLLDKTASKNYFQQYGKVLRIRLRPKHKTVIVEFANEESAQTAYAESGHFLGQDFHVSWTKTKVNDKRKSRKKLNDSNWSEDSEIKNELEAMKGNFTINKGFNYNEQSQNSPKKMPVVPKINKVRQWKADKPIKPKYTESLTDQENELLKTIMTSASTNEEKFRILDARDKLIRSRTVRQSELARAVRTIGTCPDMCPEKERLMREVQHQVAAYEQQAGSTQKNTMNHKLAVKQYSRSSADQESPLAHELRPVEVLQLTMGYLLHRILDLCESPEVNLAEWYHFVWDRTRGIRKDVTQQELCCEKSVQLVEQCARFHVHCAARLVAEDVSVFDDKINTENLTKCLQTLKYMYHDLRVKHGICCKNEAEFRAYIVLLNLNDGNFMWEVQHLSANIQRSPEIRFALDVYSALDKNNYVRFFKLIKTTSYLNACILLRYFNQVRFRALLTIIKSYSPRLPYPVVDLCGMLAFEDIPSTITFFEYHGLQLNEDKTHFLLDRSRFRQSDTPFALDRAINVVESKRNISVGEIVCGEPLPPKYFQTHVPHESFDDKGYLKISELPKDFQNKYQQFLKQFTHVNDEPSEENVEIIENVETVDNVENVEMVGNVDDVVKITEEPKQFSFISPTFFPPKPDNKPKTTGGFVFQLPKPTPPTTIKTTTTTTIKNQDISETDGETTSIFGPSFWGKNPTPPTTNIFGNKKPIEEDVITEKPAQILPPATIPETISNKEKEIQQQKKIEQKLIEEQKQKQKQKREQEHKLAEAKQNEIKKQQQIKDERKKQIELLYEQQLKHEIEKIVDEVLEEVEENLIKNRLEQISENIKMRKVLQYGRRWRNLTKISKKKRKNFFDNPVWVSTRSIQQEADELFSLSQNLTLHDIKRYKVGTPNTIVIKNKRNFEKINIHETVWKILFEQLSTPESLNLDIFWKVGIFLPELHNNEKLIKNLEECLDIDRRKMELIQSIKSNNGGTLNVCIKKIQQNESNVNGIICFYSKTIEQLIHNFKCPIVILIKTNDDLELIEKQLKQNELISQYIILNYNDTNFNKILTKSLEFLAKHHHSTTNKFETNECATILRNCLGEEFWLRIKSSMQINTRFSIFLQKPNNVIDLYNKSLKLCTQILFDKTNYELPTFPEEFRKIIANNSVCLPCPYEYFPEYWKCSSYLNKLQKIIREFRIPKMTQKWPPTNQKEFHDTLDSYCSKIFKQKATNIVYKIMSVVFKTNDERDFMKCVDCISWVDVIEIIVLEKINLMRFHDDKYPIYTLVYNKKEMSDFRSKPWWFQVNFIQKGIRQIKYVEEFYEPEIIMDVSLETDQIDFEGIYEKKICDHEALKGLDEINVLLDDLEKSMEIQKKIMRKFEEKALMALD